MFPRELIFRENPFYNPYSIDFFYSEISIIKWRIQIIGYSWEPNESEIKKGSILHNQGRIKFSEMDQRKSW